MEKNYIAATLYRLLFLGTGDYYRGLTVKLNTHLRLAVLLFTMVAEDVCCLDVKVFDVGK